MTRRMVSFLVLVALLLPAAAAPAQDAEVDGLRSRVRELERLQQQTLAELDALRARLDGDSPPPPLAPARAGADEVDLDVLSQGAPVQRQIDFHGHVALSYFGYEETNLSSGSGPALSDLDPPSSFELSDLTFFVGIPILDNLYAATEIEYDRGGDQVDVDQAFLQWDLFPEERLSLRMGKFYVPFGIERHYQNAPTNPLANRPAAYIWVIPGTWSDSGFQLLGERSFASEPEIGVEYEIALTNGLGAELFRSARDARQNADNNSNKTVAGRLGFTWDRWLRLGASGLYSEYDDEDNDEFVAVGADLRARWDRWFLRSEYVWTRIERPVALDADGGPCTDPSCAGQPQPPTPLGGRFDRRGWYAEGTYRRLYPALGRFGDLEYVVRYDWLDANDSRNPDDDFLDGQRVAFGLVLRPHDHFRLKFQYEIIDEDTSEFDNNAFLFEGSVDW